MLKASDLLLRSNAVFTGSGERPRPGFVAVAGNRIAAVGGGDGSDFAGPSTWIYELGDRLICPGFCDTHCFFTGYLLTQSGALLSDARTADEVIRMAKSSPDALACGGALILGRGVRPEIGPPKKEVMDETFGETPAVLFVSGGDSCWMNSAAETTYGFPPDACWSENCWRLLRALLKDRERSVPAFRNYLTMLNARGVTSVKEMGFDDFYGFPDALGQLEQEDALSMRVHFMSQPVGAPMNLEYGKAMRSRFSGGFVRFSGYNQMTDGSISQLEAEMKEPYLCADTCCAKKIDWAGLEADTLAADAEGFRYSLHAQGDAAICKTLDIFEKCRRGPDGKVLNRHAMTDLECSDPADLERMGRLGVTAEVYPQIMSIADRAGKLAMIREKIGTERGRNYWNRRKMQDSGVVLSCATDLPLLVDNIPESVYHSVYGLFPEGGEPFNRQNTLTVGELLTAWTRGGQYNLGRETELGTLEAGKLADIAVLDTNLFQAPPDEARAAQVCLTLVDGQVVWDSLR
ncbi:N-substituted formamide deformylase [Caprobacter fermentans]|uniref:N-substituted formamide deformylase n=1 Tax=Caproicibacter fermentans TaxID=2576756 RepID=A0A6N8HWF8_9FIRM|nr:amidohydrolase family protein [Caproicibacter fermentans]MVB09998.1 N-substituted formamide deformylase [Caproicibacter fermentans]